jgi:hypothetical protein
MKDINMKLEIIAYHDKVEMHDFGHYYEKYNFFRVMPLFILITFGQNWLLNRMISNYEKYQH